MSWKYFQVKTRRCRIIIPAGYRCQADHIFHSVQEINNMAGVCFLGGRGRGGGGGEAETWSVDVLLVSRQPPVIRECWNPSVSRLSLSIGLRLRLSLRFWWPHINCRNLTGVSQWMGRRSHTCFKNSLSPYTFLKKSISHHTVLSDRNALAEIERETLPAPPPRRRLVHQAAVVSGIPSWQRLLVLLNLRDSGSRATGVLCGQHRGCDGRVHGRPHREVQPPPPPAPGS